MKTALLLTLVVIVVSCSPRSHQHDFEHRSLILLDSISLIDRIDHDVSSFVLDGHSWYITMSNSPVVIVADSLFRERKRYERHGKGPAELLDARDIATTLSTIWVSDFVGLAIHRFSRDLEYIDRIPLDFRPFSIRPISDSLIWVGTMDMVYEDLYGVSISGNQYQVKRLHTHPVQSAPESIVLQSGGYEIGIIYRPFTNQVTVFKNEMPLSEFDNISRPARVKYDNTLAGPMPTEKVHQNAFVTHRSICLLSGKPEEKRQPVACFTHIGNPTVAFELTPSMSNTFVKGDTLYTYSPHTHHVYRYILDF